MKERDRCVRAVPSPDFPKESIACGAFTEGGPFCAKHASPATPHEDTRGGEAVAWLSQGGDVSRSAADFREMGFHEPYTPLYARSAGPEAEHGREGVSAEDWPDGYLHHHWTCPSTHDTGLACNCAYPRILSALERNGGPK